MPPFYIHSDNETLIVVQIWGAGPETQRVTKTLLSFIIRSVYMIEIMSGSGAGGREGGGERGWEREGRMGGRGGEGDRGAERRKEGREEEGGWVGGGWTEITCYLETLPSVPHNRL